VNLQISAENITVLVQKLATKKFGPFLMNRTKIRSLRAGEGGEVEGRYEENMEAPLLF
jgi:hypothetical protein